MNDRLDRALGLLERVAKAISKLPDELRMDVEVSAGTVEVTFTGNPADTKRLVGRQKETLNNIEALFRLLARGTGRNVRICYLNANQNPEPPFAPFVAKQDWKRFEVENLLKDLTETIFELPVEMRTVPKNAWSVKMYASIQAELGDDPALKLFDRIVNVLFVVIGTNYGMKVYAHAEDWIEAARKKASTVAAN